MLTLSYTKSTTLQDSLTRISALRAEILTMPLTIKAEQRAVFRSSIQTIYNSLSLAGFPITHDEIIAILSAQKQLISPSGVAVLSYRNALLWIMQHWAGNTEKLAPGDLQVLATVLLSKPSHIARTFTQQIKDIESLTIYLSRSSDHPIVLAGLAHAYFLTHPLNALDNGIFARTLSALILSQHGFTLRGMATHMIELQERKSYEFAKETMVQYGQCTQWLEYVATTIETTYTRLHLSLIRESRTTATLQRIDRAGELTKREEDIMTLLSIPTAKITNREIQLRFHISPITASRHLKKLSNLGFLFPHGKGRSVYYTRI